MSRFWNFKEIKNADNNTESIELRIEGEIVSNDNAWIYEWFEVEHTSPNSFRSELSNYKEKDITVWIDSYGGDVFAGAGIYNALKEHKGKVTVKIDGKAMSIASVIAMAGDEILMSPVSVLMIHNPWTTAQGDMRDMRKTAEVLDIIKDTLMNAYINKTGKSKEEIASMLDDETWMSSNVAIQQGFADDVLYHEEGQPIRNNMSFNRMKILNSANASLNKFIEMQKKKNNKEIEIKNKEELELLKSKLSLELEM